MVKENVLGHEIKTLKSLIKNTRQTPGLNEMLMLISLSVNV